jgi:hypothetical protein
MHYIAGTCYYRIANMQAAHDFDPIAIIAAWDNGLQMYSPVHSYDSDACTVARDNERSARNQ